MTTTTALKARVQRALRKNGERLYCPRSAYDRQQLGDYCVVDINREVVTASHCDLEALAAELGVNA